MTTERGLTMEQELERAVLLERLRRRRAQRRAAAATSQPAARVARTGTARSGPARPAD